MSLAFRVGKKEHMIINKNKSDVFPRLNFLTAELLALPIAIFSASRNLHQFLQSRAVGGCEAMVATETEAARTKAQKEAHEKNERCCPKQQI